MRRSIFVVAVSATLMAGATALPAASAAKTSARVKARAAGTCGVGSGRGYGYSYLTWLWVYHTGCKTGRNVAHHHGHLKGWSCSRKILDRSPVQYDAKVTCHSGKAKVQWTYTQNK